jgi:hypothetical protein
MNLRELAHGIIIPPNATGRMTPAAVSSHAHKGTQCLDFFAVSDHDVQKQTARIKLVH